MENITIIKGRANSKMGSKLNGVALDYMAHTLVGTKDTKLIGGTLAKLWKLDGNRFSNQYSYEAQLNDKTVGVITAYPASAMFKLGINTIKQLLKIRKWDLVWYSFMHLRDAIAMLTLKEGAEGEYHIGTLATSSESRGYGVGTKLIHFIEEQARQQHYKLCSLTVKKENKKAIHFYKKLGYQIVESIEQKPYFIYRMAKNLYPLVLA
jgi:ribosomal protein S18 acetylase RimI-like enzyme